jgi:hypothetical protein
VSHATRAEQRLRWSSIAALSDADQLPAPSLLLVGRVATQDAQSWGERVRPELLSFAASKLERGKQ